MSTLSTGQRQKMNFARGLLNDPWILFLDEPTLGLDVSAARAVRELVTAWQAAVPGRTVLLTTHYMAEADELCDRIAIVDHGRILAIGTPGRAQAAGPARVDLPARARPAGRRAGRARPPARASCQRARPRATGRRPPTGQTVEVNLVLDEDAALGGVVGALGGLGTPILALRKSEPSLEDVFVELVGRGFDEDGAGADRPDGPADAARGRRDGRPRRPSTSRRARAERSGRDRRLRPSATAARPRGGRVDPSPDPRTTCGRRRSRLPAGPGMAREPSWLFFEILLPFLTTSAFVFVYRALQSPPEYIGFVVLGGAMTAFWLNVVWMMAAQLYWEKDQGNLELYFAAPMNVMAVLFGMAVGGLFMSATRAVVVLVVATLVYGVRSRSTSGACWCSCSS